jgi:hypothetical protein
MSFDNALLESVGALKTECVEHHTFATYQEAKTILFEYIEVFTSDYASIQCLAVKVLLASSRRQYLPTLSLLHDTGSRSPRSTSFHPAHQGKRMRNCSI